MGSMVTVASDIGFCSFFGAESSANFGVSYEKLRVFFQKRRKKFRREINNILLKIVPNLDSSTCECFESNSRCVSERNSLRVVFS